MGCQFFKNVYFFFFDNHPLNGNFVVITLIDCRHSFFSSFVFMLWRGTRAYDNALSQKERRKILRSKTLSINTSGDL